MRRHLCRPRPGPQRQRGAGLVETTLVLPTLLFLVLGLWQAALGYHAKSSVNYATFEAARAGSVANASRAKIMSGFQRAMLGYYGGGRTAAELASTGKKVLEDITGTVVRIEILSPTQESFDDYNSP